MLKEINGDFLQLLRGFYHVAQTKNVTAAARIMNRNQSTVSIQIKKLEETLNTSLFLRAGKGMLLSPAGVRLYQKCLRLFDIVEDIQTNIGNDANMFNGSIGIACLSQVSACYLPRHVAKFRARYPQVSFTINSGMSSMIQHLVSSGEVDFGIMANTGMIPDSFSYHDLFRTSVELIVPSGNPWKLSTPVTAEEVLNLPFIGFSEACLIHKNVDNFFLSHQRPFVPVIRVPYYEQLLSYIAIGQGAGILEKFIFDSQQNSLLKAYPISHLLDDLSYGLVRKKNKYISPQANAFINFLLEKISLPGEDEPACDDFSILNFQ